MDGLVKLVHGKAAIGGIIRDKALGLLQAWGDAFRPDRSLAHIPQTYAFLKQQGVEFPSVDLDAMAPIVTPVASVPATERAGRPTLPAAHPHPHPHPHPRQHQQGPMTDAQLAARLAAQFEQEDADALASGAGMYGVDSGNQGTTHMAGAGQPAPPSQLPHAHPPQRGRVRIEYRVQRVTPGQQVSKPHVGRRPDWATFCVAACWVAAAIVQPRTRHGSRERVENRI